MVRGSLRVLVFALVLIHAPGCSREARLYPVRGRVTYSDGEPVTSGTVECYSAKDHVTSRGHIQADGTFLLETPGKGMGAIEGSHQAIVVQNLFPLGKAAEHAGHSVPPRKVAKRYSRYESTPLTLSVSPSQPNVDVVLTVEDGR